MCWTMVRARSGSVRRRSRSSCSARARSRQSAATQPSLSTSEVISESVNPEILSRSISAIVVAIGVGPGVGVELLARQVARVVAVDPSAVMVDETIRRNRRTIDANLVEVVRTDAADLPLGAAQADGAVAVNSIQLWEPLAASLAEVARVLRPGGRLVTLTHDWAIERNTRRSPDAWAEWVRELATPVGLTDLTYRRAQAERGRSVTLTLTKATPL